MVLDDLAAVLDRLADTDPADLADRHSVIALHRLRNRLDAITTRAAAAFDTNRSWQDDKAHCAAAWITATCHLPRATTNAEIARGRRLRHLPVADAAWAAGDIAAAHLDVLGRARRPATETRLAADEAHLVNQAKTLRFSHFCSVMAYWSQLADPDGDDRNYHHTAARRRFHLSRSWHDLWYGDLVLDPIGGAIVARQLETIETEMFQADWAAARHRMGREPSIIDLDRDPGQRRADALVEMATRAGAAPLDGRRPEPLFTVLVGWETLNGRICQLADGNVIAPAALIPWLDQAWLERVVFDSPSRVIDVGAARRLFTGATRRAIEIRDQHCYHPTCEEPADHCDIDHIIPYAAGGPTTQDNGRAACGYTTASDTNHPHPTPGEGVSWTTSRASPCRTDGAGGGRSGRRRRGSGPDRR